MRTVTVALVLACASACSPATLVPDAAIDCEYCRDWNRPFVPLKIADRTWYVGTDGLSSILIDTGDGLILLDGALPQSAPLIAANVESLGYSLSDIEIIGLSHAHYDHAGGLAALARASGARVVALAPQAEALRAGRPTPDDPQYDSHRFPAIERVEIIEDGWRSPMGDVHVTAVHTPGHTPGGTTWLWEDCRGDECYSIAYVDSLTPIGSEGFDWSGVMEQYRQSLGVLRSIDCDIFLAPHPSRFGLHDGGSFVDGAGCSDYADESQERLQRKFLTD